MGSVVRALATLSLLTALLVLVAAQQEQQEQQMPEVLATPAVHQEDGEALSHALPQGPPEEESPSPQAANEDITAEQMQEEQNPQATSPQEEEEEEAQEEAQEEAKEHGDAAEEEEQEDPAEESADPEEEEEEDKEQEVEHEGDVSALAAAQQPANAQQAQALTSLLELTASCPMKKAAKKCCKKQSQGCCQQCKKKKKCGCKKKKKKCGCKKKCPAHKAAKRCCKKHTSTCCVRSTKCKKKKHKAQLNVGTLKELPIELSSCQSRMNGKPCDDQAKATKARTNTAPLISSLKVIAKVDPDDDDMPQEWQRMFEQAHREAATCKQDKEMGVECDVSELPFFIQVGCGTMPGFSSCITDECHALRKNCMTRELVQRSQ